MLLVVWQWAWKARSFQPRFLQVASLVLTMLQVFMVLPLLQQE
jgi:hypothetical protein